MTDGSTSRSYMYWKLAVTSAFTAILYRRDSHMRKQRCQWPVNISLLCGGDCPDFATICDCHSSLTLKSSHPKGEYINVRVFPAVTRCHLKNAVQDELQLCVSKRASMSSEIRP